MAESGRAFPRPDTANPFGVSLLILTSLIPAEHAESLQDLSSRRTDSEEELDRRPCKIHPGCNPPSIGGFRYLPGEVVEVCLLIISLGKAWAPFLVFTYVKVFRT